MMTLTGAPPAPDGVRAPQLAEQALFAQARRCRRRRWVAGGVVMILIASAAAAAGLTWPAGQGTGHQAGAGSAWPRTSAAASAVVWVDSLGRVHVGQVSDAGRLRQRVVAEANPASLSLVSAGDRVYWVDPAGAYVPALRHWSQVVRYLDLRTGRTGLAGAGETVAAAPGGTSLFLARSPTVLARIPTVLAQIPPGGAARTFSTPEGWYLPGGDGLADVLSGAGLATPGGVLVQSRPSPGVGSRTLGLWRPGSRAVTVIGRGRGVLAAYTPPGRRYSLLAWLTTACRPPGSCLIRILNTSSGVTWTIRSPLPGGFAYGGAFSPDGTTLAAFVASRSRRAARLALIDVATGTVRLTGRALPLGEDFGWVTWLPDGRALLAGTSAGGYLISAATLAERPLTIGGSGRAQGPDYTSVIVRGRR
ncbi:MAG: hypothetical protein ACR2FU_06895 [Streptosporangiaceae bacterium]